MILLSKVKHVMHFVICHKPAESLQRAISSAPSERMDQLPKRLVENCRPVSETVAFAPVIFVFLHGNHQANDLYSKKS